MALSWRKLGRGFSKTKLPRWEACHLWRKERNGTGRWDMRPEAYLRAQSLQSCPAAWDPMRWIPPGSSVHGILQAGILEWVVISSFRGSSRPRDQTLHLLLCRQIFWLPRLYLMTNWGYRSDRTQTVQGWLAPTCLDQRMESREVRRAVRRPACQSRWKGLSREEVLRKVVRMSGREARHPRIRQLHVRCNGEQLRTWVFLGEWPFWTMSLVLGTLRHLCDCAQ